MKHVLLNPERYRLPDYPFIEKSERGCLSASIGTVDKGGVEEDGSYRINNIRFFYQGKQCYFLLEGRGSSEDDPLYRSTRVEFYIGNTNGSYVGEPLNDAYFTMFTKEDNYQENPTKVSNSYKEYENNGVSITKEELWSNRNNRYELHICSFNQYIALIGIEKDDPQPSIEMNRLRSLTGYKNILIKPYIEGAFETIDLLSLSSGNRVIIHYNSYTYNCGCLDLDINRFE